MYLRFLCNGISCPPSSMCLKASMIVSDFGNTELSAYIPKRSQFSNPLHAPPEAIMQGFQEPTKHGDLRGNGQQHGANNQINIMMSSRPKNYILNEFIFAFHWTMLEAIMTKKMMKIENMISRPSGWQNYPRKLPTISIEHVWYSGWMATSCRRDNYIVCRLQSSTNFKNWLMTKIYVYSCLLFSFWWRSVMLTIMCNLLKKYCATLLFQLSTSWLGVNQYCRQQHQMLI